jgi:hypothetical protein
MQHHKSSKIKGKLLLTLKAVISCNSIAKEVHTHHSNKLMVTRETSTSSRDLVTSSRMPVHIHMGLHLREGSLTRSRVTTDRLYLDSRDMLVINRSTKASLLRE